MVKKHFKVLCLAVPGIICPFLCVLRFYRTTLQISLKTGALVYLRHWGLTVAFLRPRQYYLLKIDL